MSTLVDRRLLVDVELALHQLLQQRRALGIPDGRCLACAQRAAYAVVLPDDHAPADVTPCARCGWQPGIIEVVYTDGPRERRD